MKECQPGAGFGREEKEDKIPELYTQIRDGFGKDFSSHQLKQFIDQKYSQNEFRDLVSFTKYLIKFEKVPLGATGYCLKQLSSCLYKLGRLEEFRDYKFKYLQFLYSRKNVKELISTFEECEKFGVDTNNIQKISIYVLQENISEVDKLLESSYLSKLTEGNYEFFLRVPSLALIQLKKTINNRRMKEALYLSMKLILIHFRSKELIAGVAELFKTQFKNITGNINNYLEDKEINVPKPVHEGDGTKIIQENIYDLIVQEERKLTKEEQLRRNIRLLTDRLDKDQEKKVQSKKVDYKKTDPVKAGNDIKEVVMGLGSRHHDIVSFLNTNGYYAESIKHLLKIDNRNKEQDFLLMESYYLDEDFKSLRRCIMEILEKHNLLQDEFIRLDAVYKYIKEIDEK